jgi:hypothetical protein
VAGTQAGWLINRVFQHSSQGSYGKLSLRARKDYGNAELEGRWECRTRGFERANLPQVPGVLGVLGVLGT